MGQSFCLFLPRLDGACFELFVREWRQAFPSGRWAVVLDNSGAHTSGHVRWPMASPRCTCRRIARRSTPGNAGSMNCESRSPTRSHDHLDALETSLTQARRPYWEHPLALVQLTAYPWWRVGSSPSRRHHRECVLGGEECQIDGSSRNH